MSAFSHVKMQMKIFRSHSGFQLFIILICRMACNLQVTCPREITWEVQNISNE